ncbi:MAG: putative 3-oxacyl-ACP reductase [Frankiales bacterium]|nr:putative 3-oxacyl-ACP reductase [Frankiales bacterium]
MSRVAVVSGGGTGIGRAIAAGLAQDGFEVVIVGRRSAVLERTAEELNQAQPPGRVSWRAADLTKAAEVERLVAELTSEFPTIDVLVNNAGATPPAADGSLQSLADSWLRSYELNVISAVLLTEGLRPALRRPGGRIVLIGSMSSRTGGSVSAYGAAKAALNGWVLSLSVQLAADGINANAVLPGYVPDTELAGGHPMPPELHARVVSRIAAGRPGLPEDTAALVRFLATEGSGFLTGQVIEVNGGTLPSTH